MKSDLTAFIFLAFLMVSCFNSEKIYIASNSEKVCTHIKHEDYFKEVQVFLFRYSVCVDDCNAPEKIIYARYNKDSLKLKIGIVLNCVGDFVLNVKTYSDTLDLIIGPRPEIIYGPDGRTDTVTTTTDCDCFFTINVGLKNLRYHFKEYLVNGKKPGSVKREVLLDYNEGTGL